MEIDYPRIRHTMLATVAPVLPTIGKIHIPTRKLITDADVSEAVTCNLQPGMILVSHDRLHLTNLMIPGAWKHAAMYDGYFVIEAVYPKVRKIALKDWMKSHDHVLILKPLFADLKQMKLASGFAGSLVGTPYDLLIEYHEDRAVNKAFYCSEVCWWSYNQVFKAAGLVSPFTPRLTMKVETTVPQDFPNATTKWGGVYLNPPARNVLYPYPKEGFAA